MMSSPKASFLIHAVECTKNFAIEHGVIMHQLFIDETLKKNRNIYNCFFFFSWCQYCLLIFRLLRKLAKRIEKHGKL